LDQIPQLTSSRPLELDDTPFSLSSTSTNGQDGTSRALLVGINYIGQNGQLGGCHNDVWNVKKYLVEVQGFQEENILVLVDDGRNRHFPTRKNIIAALRQSVAQSMPGDSVYFHYSGTVVLWASSKSAWISVSSHVTVFVFHS
jgi:metacaspase-1